jgi:hypothetical protein
MLQQIFTQNILSGRHSLYGNTALVTVILKLVCILGQICCKMRDNSTKVMWVILSFFPD